MMTILSCIADNNNPWMVALAVSICIAGSWATVRLFKRAAATQWPEKGAWFVLAVLITGASIWCTHFIAILGYDPGTSIGFDPVLTIVSLLVAMAGAGIGFLVASAGGRAASLVGGAILGLAIVTMHYTGLMGYRVQGIVSWDPFYLAASIAISCCFSAACLSVIDAFDDTDSIYLGTALLVLAIVGLHFTGMAALRVEPMAVDGSFSNPAAMLALAIAVATVAVIVIGAGFASCMIDHRSRANAADALSNMSNGLVAVSSSGLITLYNSRVVEIFKLAEHEIQVEMPLSTFLANIGERSGWDRSQIERVVRNHKSWFSMRETTHIEQEFADGRVVALVCRPLSGRGAVLTYEDVTEARVGQKQIAHMAYHDALTGLANRRLFGKAIEDASATYPFDLLMIDLDRFKAVNDRFGHPAGDELLVQVARRLQAALEEEDLVFRLGGDEFAVIIPLGSRGPVELASRIVETLAIPFMIGTNIMNIGCSIGVASFRGAVDGSTVQRRADVALYKAKNEGRGRVESYQTGMFEEVAGQEDFCKDLRLAAERGQLELYYQPLYSLPEQHLVGFEALVRWRHPERGMLSPAHFIPAAEASGAIDRIGAWVIDEAFREASSWPRHLYVSVNVSAVQLQSPSILSHLRRAMLENDLSPRQIEIELTETTMVNNSGQIAAVLAGFQALGIRLAMDDFGTGYSSLGYLRDLKVDRIKIDRSFLTGVGQGDGKDTSAVTVLRAIMGMARELSIETTAEGIETDRQLKTVAMLGCGTGQGYFLGRPMDFTATRRLANAHDQSLPHMRAGSSMNG